MTTYESGRADEWSDLCNLADVAEMVYDEEQGAKKGKVEEEESDEKRFFHSFPRKTRSWVRVTRRYPQNLNGASTSMLFDLNKTPCDFETNYLQLQWYSSSSSSSFLGDYKIEADISKKTETKNPPNPNSQLSPCKSRKRRAVQERKRKGLGFKKAKVVPFSWIGKEKPEWLVQMMREMNVDEDPKLIFEKVLSVTDVEPGQSRFLIPFNQLTRNDFLTQVESSYINGPGGNNGEDDEGKRPGMGAILVNAKFEKLGVIFKLWEMKKDSGKGTLNYALNCGWNEVVTANKLEQGHTISLWSFRFQEVLCFALVLPPPTMA